MGIEQPFVAKGSQPTYEELKPHRTSRHSNSTGCSQPTYEELKRHINRAIINRDSSSQPTYEELKQKKR